MGWGKGVAVFSRKYMGGGEGAMQCFHVSIWGWGKRAMYHAIFSRKYMGVGEASHATSFPGSSLSREKDPGWV